MNIKDFPELGDLVLQSDALRPKKKQELIYFLLAVWKGTEIFGWINAHVLKKFQKGSDWQKILVLKGIGKGSLKKGKKKKSKYVLALNL